MASSVYNSSMLNATPASPMRPGRVPSPLGPGRPSSPLARMPSPLSPGGRRGPKQICGPWADEPLPLMETPSRTFDISHPAIHVANDFTHTYNAVLRTLNAIYLQAPHVTAMEDVVDFLFLVHGWYDWVMGIQVHRQRFLFPEFDEALGRQGYLTGLLKGDLDYGRPIQRIGEFAETTFGKPETYNPAMLQKLIDELAPSFEAYFGELIGKLLAVPSTPGAPGEAEYRANRLLNSHVQFEKYLKDSLDKYTVQPLLLQSRDTTFEGGNTWPGWSVPAVHAVADRLSPRYAGSWRFMPCDVWGKPRELPFLGDDRGKGKSVLRASQTSQYSQYSQGSENSQNSQISDAGAQNGFLMPESEEPRVKSISAESLVVKYYV